MTSEGHSDPTNSSPNPGSPHPAGDLKINIPHQANEAHRPVDYPRKKSTNQSSISSTNTERQQYVRPLTCPSRPSTRGKINTCAQTITSLASMTKPLLCSSRLVPSQVSVRHVDQEQYHHGCSGNQATPALLPFCPSRGIESPAAPSSGQMEHSSPDGCT
ncbi:hypothetical protein V8E36_006971 [Tilletia maclaganii]